MSTTGKASHLVGVDLGGTKIMAGVFDNNLECLGWSKVSTKSQRGPAAVIDRIARCVMDAVDECDLKMEQVRGIGIGAPGSVEPEPGRVVFAPNLGWENVALRKELEKRLERPVVVENDCNICTLGIFEKELDSKPQHLVGIFIGTGIGGGLVVNGQPYGGFNRTAGEVRHGHR
jgi:glucokinase